MSDSPQISPEEAVALSSSDSIFYSQYFFSKTCRQDSPKFHTKVWEKLESSCRYISLSIFRGSGKTSLTRIYISKQVAFGISRTILIVGKSEKAAIYSVTWLAKQVSYNTLWANTFGLSPGDKWSPNDGDIEIRTLSGETVRVMAYGMTSSLRGINIDDYRPDLIVGDDICDEGNSLTADQREKIADIWFGALKDSLSPASESPLARQILLGTPIDPDDANARCLQDEQYGSLAISCFNEDGNSVWPGRYPTEELLKEKKGAIARNQLSLWLREMEVTLITRENAIFTSEWLQYWTILPEGLRPIMIIDPVPPPSNREIKRSLKGKDYEVMTIMARQGSNIFLIHYSMNRGHNPTWTLAEFWRLVDLYEPRRIIVETIAYQRTLKWILERSMQERRRFIQIDDNSDKRSKFDTIVDGLSGIASNHHLYFHKSHIEAIEQFGRYPKIKHDDVIETIAVGCERLQAMEGLSYDEDEMLALPEWRIA